ncbi:MAG: hypothetical protein WDW38_008063 [Sanguina aurantia]
MAAATSCLLPNMQHPWAEDPRMHNVTGIPHGGSRGGGWAGLVKRSGAPETRDSDRLGDRRGVHSSMGAPDQVPREQHGEDRGSYPTSANILPHTAFVGTQLAVMRRRR